MPSLLTRVLTRGELLRGGVLRAELLAVSGPSYEDPTAILDRELQTCNRAYLGYDAFDRLVCFYLTTWGDLRVGDEVVPTLHLGLSATREDTKNSGAIARLYAACIRDAAGWEEKHGRRLLLWSTTASPTVFLGVTRYLGEPEPRADGSFTEFGRVAAAALAQELHGTAAPEHPFVLKGVARGTRYSSSEKHRIGRVRSAKRFTLFESLGIDEHEHDRLLFIARVPTSLSPHVLKVPHD